MFTATGPRRHGYGSNEGPGRDTDISLFVGTDTLTECRSEVDVDSSAPWTSFLPVHEGCPLRRWSRVGVGGGLEYFDSKTGRGHEDCVGLRCLWAGPLGPEQGFDPGELL